MNSKQSEYFVHFTMAMVGGFLGCYALMNHHELFGNAQTSNLIHIAMCLVGTNFTEFLYRLLDLALYFSGFACTVFLSKFTKFDLHFCSVLFNLLTIVILFVMPRSLNDFIFLAPVFFAMAFQWNSFQGAGGYVSSTIFSTNNFRQFSTSLCEYFCDGDRVHLRKTRFYAVTLLSYHMGVVIAYLVSKAFGLGGVLAGIGLVLISGVAVCRDNGWEWKKLAYCLWQQDPMPHKIRQNKKYRNSHKKIVDKWSIS